MHTKRLFIAAVCLLCVFALTNCELEDDKIIGPGPQATDMMAELGELQMCTHNEPGPNLVPLKIANKFGQRMSISSVPGGYVYSDLNPSFEVWENYKPAAWNIDISSPYDIPSEYELYQYPAIYAQQETQNVYHGESAVRLYLRRANRALSSAYFELANEDREAGTYTATIYFAGNPQDIDVALSMTLFDEYDHVIDTVYGVMSTSGGYTPNNVSIETQTAPKYVRFSVLQVSGSGPNYVYVDKLSLEGPEGVGDVSLPVTLSSFNATYILPGGTGNPMVKCNWVTQSEVDNWRFWLYFRTPIGTLVKASNTYFYGQGNKSTSTTYSNKYFVANSTFNNYYSSLYPGSPINFVLASQDYSGETYYYTDFEYTIYK